MTKIFLYPVYFTEFVTWTGKNLKGSHLGIVFHYSIINRYLHNGIGNSRSQITIEYQPMRKQEQPNQPCELALSLIVDSTNQLNRK